ncbi:hypothetical protein [Actinomadura hibisca]|uniref:hypothetical protein n=1 Tax=Actinomadura hibisca TaxID=68565 RepID=UPI0008309537|nr:hypothetical protein [Actinomadura hibisca]
MSDDPERAKGKQLARKLAAYDALMLNLPTAAHPFRGDPEVVKRALEILNEPDLEAAETGTDSEQDIP